MANLEHVKNLRQGTQSFNQWRLNNPKLLLNLLHSDFNIMNLSGANLSGAMFSFANLVETNLSKANLQGADLSNVRLTRANLSGADLSNANLSGSRLVGTNLSGANLSNANLLNANLTEANLCDLNLSGATFGHTVLGGLDFRFTSGLELANHVAPSSLGIDTAIASHWQIPEVFLRGCGISDIFIQYIGSLTNQPIQYYSCFISYSTKDQDFAQRLYNDLQANNVRCWFAPEDIQGGKKLHEQLDEAIRVFDKLLLILRSSSMESAWVKTEIAKARKREITQKRQMLFPVRLVDFATLQCWDCFDADVGKDSAREIREYFIPDFSEWKVNHDKYQ